MELQKQMKAKLLLPRQNQNGNLLWCIEDISTYASELSKSIEIIKQKGYWASPFPEGDGVTFSCENTVMVRNEEDVLKDFVDAFDWLDVILGTTGNSNLELAELDDGRREMKCIVIVPLEKVFRPCKLDCVNAHQLKSIKKDKNDEQLRSKSTSVNCKRIG